jgi:hypothetical protein
MGARGIVHPGILMATPESARDDIFNPSGQIRFDLMTDTAYRFTRAFLAPR